MFKFISLLASIKLLLTIMFSSFRSLCTISTKKINNKWNEMKNGKIIRGDTSTTKKYIWSVNVHHRNTWGGPSIILLCSTPFYSDPCLHTSNLKEPGLFDSLISPHSPATPPAAAPHTKWPGECGRGPCPRSGVPRKRETTVATSPVRFPVSVDLQRENHFFPSLHVLLLI